MRIVGHIEQAEIPRLNTRADVVNRFWRVKYILKEIDEATFKEKVQRQDKVDSKNQESSQVLVMICHTITDELRQVAVRQKETLDAEYSILNLIDYANDALNRISLRYSQVTPRIVTVCASPSTPWHVVYRHGPMKVQVANK